MRQASTRSEPLKRPPFARHCGPGTAQWSVGSIELEGIRYGLITHCLIASTIRIAPAIVTSQSIVTRQLFGSPAVSRSIGFRDRGGGVERVSVARSGSETGVAG